ncbi:DUF6370 family protein [Gemmata sp. JC717]|uniref:DUF6370 family protein n=1 Tax=Gemmata algarum TaxID=2975278 RepID=A0ABU5ESA1_9BACT|nr:DUF6370 family protein [Gemmata algarum]MDY3555921.1 DUF6370 family protein [Gemmata algarum]MDY3558228.1 DUF6370 family protein [Gemmata algarum]
MLRAALALALGFAVVTLAGSGNLTADEKKPETKKLEGKLTCTKCSLSETKTCGHALVVKEGEKEVKYYLSDKGAKETYHGKCCTAPVDATVTGKVVEKDKKLTIEEPKVEIKK